MKIMEVVGILAIFIIGFFSYPSIYPQIYHSEEYVELGSFSKIIFDEIPEVYFDGLNDIVLEKGKTLDYEISNRIDGEDTGGFYSPIDKEIYIFNLDWKQKDSMERDIYHEIGHHIWYNFLEEEDKIEWEILYNNTKTFVSPYASTNSHEDFAENMVVYFDQQDFYIRIYYGAYNDYAISYSISDDKLKFIIERIIMRYEPERFEEIRI